MDITDLLSSKVYKSFDEQYKGSKKYMAHTLVVYIFIIFAVFVKDAKIPKVIQEFKCTNLIKFKHFRMILIMKGNLMKQLILCIVTCSPNIVFHITPLTLKSFCPDLVKEIGRIADNVVDKKRALDKVNGSGNNQSNNSNNKYQDNNHNNNNNSNGDGNNSNNNGNHSKSNVVNNNKRPEFIGSIINRTGNNIYFPWLLKKKY